MDIFNKLVDYQEEPVRAIMRRAKQAEKGNVVFFGDSLIQGYDLKKWFPDQTYYNCGVNGATSALLMHLHIYAVGDYKPNNVVLLIGTNDLSETNQFEMMDIITNIYSLIEIMNIRYGLKKVFVISPLPIDEARKKTSCRNNQRLKMLGKDLEKSVCEYDNVEYIDVFDTFIKDGTFMDELTDDGLHLNEKGYEILTMELKKHL